MLHKLALIFILCLFIAQGYALTDEQYGQRVKAHMVVGDNISACYEAYAGLQAYPQSKILWMTYLRALAKAGDEKTLMAHWRLLSEKFPEERTNRELLECLAWAVIEKGSVSSAPLIRVTAMLGAFFSQDAKGVSILLKGLRDEHIYLRAAVIKLASLLHDTAIQDVLLDLLRTEKVWSVRLEVIQAVGKLRMADARPDLMKIIAQENAHIEEKTAAIEALVILSDEAEREHVMSLAKSDRVGMRLLACEMIAHYMQKDDIDLLYPLLYDYHAAVRAKFFETLGRLRITRVGGNDVAELAAKSTGDPDPLVAITAAWVLTLNDPGRGQRAFATLLQHQTEAVRHLASSALGAVGKYGLPLTLQAFHQQTDPYIKMNLALGLIGQRLATQTACDCLFQGLNQQKERWAWQEEGGFRTLAPSKEKHDEAIPNYPEAVNQLTRLEVLQVLAVVHYPKAQQAIKNFLQESNWGITGLAAALLLTEGDEDAVELVKQLLQDPDQKIRVQAALILSLWGSGEDAVSLLQSSYGQADRELKGQILEGIGRVGAQSSLTFLADRLQEPFPTLRIVAAAALLECLYH